jgi:hypothetical protein
MKFKRVIIAAAFLVFILLLSACSSINQAVANNVSEVHHSVFDGQTQNLKATVVSGKKEKDYKMDGASGKKTDFCVISIQPQNGLDGMESFKYKFSYDKKTYEGDLTAGRFGDKFSAEIELLLTGCDELALTVSSGDITEDVLLESKMSDGIISSNEALDLAKMEFRDKIEELYQSGKLGCEIYIRYVNSVENQDGDYFWYVAFLQADEKFFAVLIDPVNSAIVAKRG